MSILMRLFLCSLLCISSTANCQHRVILKKGLNKLVLKEGMYIIPILKSDTISKVDWTQKCKFGRYTKKDSIWLIEEINILEDRPYFTFKRVKNYGRDTIPMDEFYRKKPSERRQWKANRTWIGSFLDSNSVQNDIYKSVNDWEQKTAYLDDLKVLHIPVNPRTCECDPDIKGTGIGMMVLGGASLYVSQKIPNYRRRLISTLVSIASIGIGASLLVPEKVIIYNLKEWSLKRMK